MWIHRPLVKHAGHVLLLVLCFVLLSGGVEHIVTLPIPGTLLDWQHWHPSCTWQLLPAYWVHGSPGLHMS